jgi:diaminopimelate decarboxylase
MTPLPGAPFLHRRGTELWLEDARLADLAALHGTPLYVYSRSAMRAALAPYQRALAGRRHLVCYAMKANSTLAVLQTFAAAGCGFDIVSAGELQRVLAVGAAPSQVVFSGVGKRRDELTFALETGVRCFNVESESELLLLSEIAAGSGRRAPVSLRVNPDVDAKTHPYISTGLRGNKFGVAHERAVAVYKKAAQLPGIDVVGIDCHIGSQVTDSAPYLAALERLLDLVESRRARRHPLIPHRSRRRPRHHLHRRGTSARRRADRCDAGAHRCTRTRASRDPDRAWALAGRECRCAARSRAGAQARRLSAIFASSTRP